MLNFSACAEKPKLNTHDERPRVIGVIAPWDVEKVRPFAPNVKPYDFIINSSYEEQLTEERLLDIYQRTHAPH